jgi:hypothetical protein
LTVARERYRLGKSRDEFRGGGESPLPLTRRSKHALRLRLYTSVVNDLSPETFDPCASFDLFGWTFRHEHVTRVAAVQRIKPAESREVWYRQFVVISVRFSSCTYCASWHHPHKRKLSFVMNVLAWHPADRVFLNHSRFQVLVVRSSIQDVGLACCIQI